jgi:membrane protease YdiL (CAAX protease family)
MIEPEKGPLDTSPPVIRKVHEPSPWLVAPIVLIVTLISFVFVGPFVGMAVAFPFYDGKPLEFLNDIIKPFGKEEMKPLLWIVQGCATFLGLAVIPPLFWKAVKQKPVFSLFDGPPVKPVFFLMIIGIVIFFMGPNSVLIQWNSNLDLPDGVFENWARQTEDSATELTKFMASFNSIGEYLVGILIIALLPGIGEEIVFRGMLQPELQKCFKNVHVGIWLSAIFFSALHLQFYGFVPRVFLGALFGYMYYWSGNLLVPMFAHFINNLFAVSVLYFGFSELPGVENTESMPVYIVAIFTALCGILLYQFRMMQNNRVLPNDIRA